MCNDQNEIKTNDFNFNEDTHEEKDISSINIEEEESFVTSLKNKKGLFGVIGSFLLILVKFKFIFIFILSKLKFLLIVLKLGKFASTIGSMLLMIVVYAQMYGWAFGIGFVMLLFIHEMGHYLSAKAIKLDVSLPLFIPFVGAVINMKEAPKDAVTEAKLAMGGPVLGSIGALICLILYFVLNEDFLMALAYTGFLLNLFNLIPLHPLDGGRTVSAISPKLWLIGIPIGVIALLKYFNPIILIMLVLGIIQVINQYKNPDKSYYNVKPSTRLAFALAYFGLMLLLGIGMTYIHGIHADLIIQ